MCVPKKFGGDSELGTQNSGPRFIGCVPFSEICMQENTWESWSPNELRVEGKSIIMMSEYGVWRWTNSFVE